MKLGFICEGETERKIVESNNFQQLLSDMSHSCVQDVIDAKGNGNLLPKNLTQLTQRLISKGAEKIIIITDLDKDVCITSTKERINAPEQHLVVVTVKEIEAWFLADGQSMSAICHTNIHVEHPEQEVEPFETIRQLMITHTGRGLGTGTGAKNRLTKRILDNGFSVLNAANHPNCDSAKYLLRKLTEL